MVPTHHKCLVDVAISDVFIAIKTFAYEPSHFILFRWLDCYIADGTFYVMAPSHNERNQTRCVLYGRVNFFHCVNSFNRNRNFRFEPFTKLCHRSDGCYEADFIKNFVSQTWLASAAYFWTRYDL